MFVIDFFKSPRWLEAENLFLRHQLSIAPRRAPPRLRLRGSSRSLVGYTIDTHESEFSEATPTTDIGQIVMLQCSSAMLALIRSTELGRASSLRSRAARRLL